MANDELIAALERTAVWCEALALCDPRDLEALVKSRHETDAALIRAHIETLRAGGERAAVVANWCRKRHDCALANGHQGLCHIAIAGSICRHGDPRCEDDPCPRGVYEAQCRP